MRALTLLITLFRKYKYKPEARDNKALIKP